MKYLCFTDFDEFVSMLGNRYDNMRTEAGVKTISIVAKYGEARDIIKELLIHDFDIHSIVSFEPPMDNRYTDEYVITLSNVDEEYGIWCEPMLRDDKYIECESDIFFILDNCSSRIIPYCKNGRKYEVEIYEMNEDYDTDYDDVDIDECHIEEGMDADEVAEIIENINKGVNAIHEILDEMRMFDRLL